jgi:molybdopterin converting factor small subunit
MNDSGKICSRKRPGGTKATAVRLSRAAEQTMNALQDHFRKYLGRPVSRSIVMRRAIEVFAKRVARQLKSDDEVAVKGEALELVKHIHC